MNKSVMAAVFAVGLAVVGWVGWGFVGASPLALVMTGLSNASHTYKAAFKVTTSTGGVVYGTAATPIATDPGPFTMTIWGVP